jgi:hypothetical protein
VFDAIKFLETYHIEYWTEGKNCQIGWVNIACPMCFDDSNHGGINLDNGYYNCWKCGKSWLDQVILKLLNVSIKEARKIKDTYTDDYVHRLNLNKDKKEKPNEIVMPGEPLNDRHRKYLSDRGFSPDYLEEKYGLKGTGITGDWKFRIMIPILYQKRLVSYQGRDYTGKAELRYKTLSKEKSIIDPKEILLNLDNCHYNIIVVVEGAFDVFRMGDGFAATLGTGIKETQIKLLSKYDEVCFLFDNEEKAQEDAKKAGMKLAALGVKVNILRMDEGKDPGGLTEQEAKEIRKEIGI